MLSGRSVTPFNVPQNEPVEVTVDLEIVDPDMETLFDDSLSPGNRFVYHKPDMPQIDLIEQVRRACATLDEILITTPMHPRYRALARTELEKVSSWANKGITFVDEPNI